MDIVKTGIGITRTIKNVSRFKEIMTVLARNGFDELIIKMNIANHIPAFVVPKARIEDALKDKEMQGKSEEYWSRAIGYRLRKSFEELGPGFIKIGQLLATRDDVFPDGFVCEMRKLRNQVKSIPLSEGREIIALSLIHI